MKHFDHIRINPNYGENPGEFGHGFYTTTAHDEGIQDTLSETWENKKTHKRPKDVVRFSIPNQVLLEKASLTNDQASSDFLVHMLQNTHGYHQGMTEDAAVGIMNNINRGGRVLLFPDDKDKRVLIKGDVRQSWREYTESNGGASDHFMVVGPNRPSELDDIRQIAFRGAPGDMLINMASRSLRQLD